jgi:LysR family glycine cleavage system transcriptional activator
MRPLPPLNYFRSYLYVGRHLNLGRAATELNVTTSALSHQLKLLETQLGTKLFIRNGRGLAFTKAGKDLHVEVEACLTRLANAVENITRTESDATLVVNVVPTFAMRWFLPRFGSFEKTCCRLDVRISSKVIDFDRDGIDCAINFDRDGNDCAIHSGHPARSGNTMEFLRHESLIVVCTPSSITAAKPLANPSDLIYHQLLHVRSRLDAKDRLEDWDTWLRSAGILERGEYKGTVLANRSFLIQAAKSGAGVAVVDPLMVQDELKSGELIQPLKMVAKSKCSYYLSYPSKAPPSEKIVAFRNWLLKELPNEDLQYWNA